jgi:hypothetical protein
MGRVFKYNKVYHSYLKHQSPIVIRFRSPVRKSDYNDDLIAFMDVRGDTNDKYYYITESAEIRDEIGKIPVNEWVKAEFAGSDDTAVIAWELAGDTGNSDDAINSYPSENVTGSFGGASIKDNYINCIQVAKDIVAVEFPDAEDTLVKDIATTLYINWSHTGFKVSLDGAAPVEADVLDGDFATIESVDALRDGLDSLIVDKGRSHDNRNLKPVLDKIKIVVNEDAITVSPKEVGDMLVWLTKEYNHQVEQEYAADPGDELPF